MSRLIATAALLVLIAVSAAVAQAPPVGPHSEVGWLDDFTHTAWYPVAYTHNSADDFDFVSEDGVGHFSVANPRRSMRWMTTVGGVNLDTYDTIEIRYRATGMATEGSGYFLWMDINPSAAKPAEHPVTVDELQADGEWHLLRKQMPRKNPGNYWLTKLVLNLTATGGPADLWIDYIRLIGERPPLQEARATEPTVLARHDLNDLSGWHQLEDVPYPGVGSMTAGEGTAEFVVEGMQRNASFVWRFDQPLAVDGRSNNVAFRYRIRGQNQIYTRNPRTLGYFMTVGAGNEERPIYLWNSLVNDGAWHVASNSFPADAFPGGLEYVRINLVSEESPRAWAELDWVQVGSGAPSAKLANLFEIGQSAPGGAFGYVDFEPTAGVTATDLLNRHHGIYSEFPTGDVTLDNIPFRLDGGAHVLGVMERDELVVPHRGSLSAIYALIATRVEGNDNFTYWGGPIRAVEEPERFIIRINYANGAVFEALPANIAGSSYIMPPGPGLFGVVNPHPDRAVESVSLVDRTRSVGFHVLGLTVQSTGAPLFAMPEAGRPLPPEPRVTDRVPDDAASIEADDGRIVMRSDYLTLEVDLREGIRVTSMASGVLGRDLAATGELFALETDAWTLSSTEVRVSGVQQLSPTSVAVQWAAEAPVQASGTLTLAWNGASEIGLKVAVTNGGQRNLKGSLVVTPLPGVVLDDRPENVWVFYPGFGTMISNDPFFENSVKSDHLPVQLVAAWSPAAGAGVYVMGHDTGPERDAEYMLEKFEGRVTAAARYLYLDLAPGESAELPEVAIGAYLGDYREAVSTFRQWMQSWYRPTAPHPEWFRRVCTFVGVTPTLSMFINDETGRMDLSPHLDAMAEIHGPIDYFHVYGWFASTEHGGQGDYAHYELLGGEETWRDAIADVKASGISVGLYIDPLLMDEKAVAADRVWPWRIIGADGELTRWSQGNFYVCPAVPECRDYWEQTYERVGRTFSPSGLYMDQVGYWNPDAWVCHNTEHAHKQPIGMRVSQAPLVRQIREAANRVDPQIVTYSEYVPTEIISQWQDGAFTHNHRFERERPATFLINPIYWVVPEVKCFEIFAGNGNVIWENTRLPLRLFWGRETLNLKGETTEYAPETAEAIRRITEVWHRYPEAFATTEPEWLVATLRRGVYANRFPGDGYDLYVLFNELPHTADGALIEVPHRADCTYREAWEGVELQPRIAGGSATISLTIPPMGVRVLVVEGAAAAL